MRVICLLSMAACAGSVGAPRGPQAENERVIEHGGKLQTDVLPVEGVRVAGDGVQLWAYAEGPSVASIQALEDKASAQARDEVGRLGQVLVQHLDLHLLSEHQDSATPQELQAIHARLQSDVVQKLSPAEHIWQKLEREGERLVRVIVRYTVPKSELKRVLDAGLGSRAGKALVVEATIDGLGR